MENKITIYTDGGYSIPKGIGGWAMVVVLNDEVIHQEHGTAKNTTSNRMEMYAFMKAMAYCQHEVTIYTDSKYVEQGYNVWSKSWKEKGWKKADNKDIKNKDWWELINFHRRNNITVKWVKAHNGNKYNELVDSLTRDYI
ncbi:MAG: ribonuclease HI [Romboutsia sp.]|nr:ribonuclease HI [Romboutsia sp.]